MAKRSLRMNRSSNTGHKVTCSRFARSPKPRQRRRRRRSKPSRPSTGCEAQSKLTFKCHLPFKWLNDLVRSPRILDAVEDVLGPNILCWGTGFFQKNASRSALRLLAPGQVLLRPGTVGNMYRMAGFHARATWNRDAFGVLPGTHLSSETLEFANEPHEHNLLQRGQTIKNLDLTPAVPMVLQAGEFSLHHEGIVHGSDPNNSDYRRIGLSIHYISTRCPARRVQRRRQPPQCLPGSWCR